MFLRKFGIIKKPLRVSTWRKKRTLLDFLSRTLCLFSLLGKFYTVLNRAHSTAFRACRVGDGWEEALLCPPHSTPAKLRRCAGGITFSNYTCPAHNVCDNIKSFPLRSTVYNAVAGSLNHVETNKKKRPLAQREISDMEKLGAFHDHSEGTWCCFIDSVKVRGGICLWLFHILTFFFFLSFFTYKCHFFYCLSFIDTER